MGDQQVKNIARPVRVFSVRFDAAVPTRLIEKSPLPLPENTVLFDPNLRFRFIPEQ